MTCLAELAVVRRTGSLIEISELEPVLLNFIASATVELDQDAIQFRASSASEAAAWLLRGSHRNALGVKLRSTDGEAVNFQHLFGLNRLLGFRGQKARYETIIPSLFRKDGVERSRHKGARKWFTAAIDAWHGSHFRYADGGLDPLGLERETATGVAQHYGIATDFVDWSWDPLVAMAFATSQAEAGDRVSVFIRPFGPGSNPSESYNVFLPPTFAGRVWRQRGFFSWQPVAPEYLDNPETFMVDGGLNGRRSRTAIHHRVSFPVTREDIGWGEATVRELYRDDFPQLLALRDWSLSAAEKCAETPWSSCRRESDFLEACNRQNLDPPSVFTTAASEHVLGEDTTEIMDYLESMALRRRPTTGGLAYQRPALVTALVAIPRKSAVKSRPNDDASRDWRLAAMPADVVRFLGLSDDMHRFDPASDLREPSDAYFLDRAGEPS